MNKRLHTYYSGLVQGVGFRFTAERAAVSFGIDGWVKNLKDGRVEILCEGKEAALKEFQSKLDSVFKDYIRDIKSDWSVATGELEGFYVRFE